MNKHKNIASVFDEMVLVSVILLNFNEEKFTLECLESLSKQTFTDFEVVLVENGSKDVGFLSVVREKYPLVKIVESPVNLGFAEGNNLGVRNCSGRYIVLLNNDTNVASDWLAELVFDFKNNSFGSIASGGAYSISDLNRYQTITLLGYNIALEKKGLDVLDNEVFYSSGCSEIFDKAFVGEPFDKDYFIYFEDMYLGWLLGLRGKKNKICVSSKLVHYGSQTTKKWGGFRTYFAEKNRVMNLFIFYSSFNLIRIFPLFVVGTVLHNIYDYSRIWYRVKSYFWLVFNFFNILEKRKKVQKLRRVSDSVIVSRMSYKLFDDGVVNSSILRFLNFCSKVYCRVVCLRTVDNKF